MKLRRPSPLAPGHVRLTERDLAALDGELRRNAPTAQRGWEVAQLLLNALLRCRSGVYAVVLWAVAAAAAPVGDVTLVWEPLQPLSSNALFVLRGSPTLTGNPTNWPVLTNVSGLSTQTIINITPGTFFFVVQSSNLWGLGPPSNVTNTPPVPVSPVLSIKAAY